MTKKISNPPPPPREWRPDPPPSPPRLGNKGAITCPECNGEGEIYIPNGNPEPDCGWNDCKVCNGRGELNPMERIKELLNEVDNAQGQYYELVGRALDAGIDLQRGYRMKTGENHDNTKAGCDIHN